MIKSFGKKGVKAGVILVGLIFAYFVLMLLACLIPSDLLNEHAKESADQIMEQGPHGEIKILSYSSYIDNWSEALMINEAISVDTNEPVKSLLLIRKNYIPGITKIVLQSPVGELKSASKYNGKLAQLNELKDVANKNIDENYESYEYSRYWHGYLVLLRPLLILGNINQIRMLISIFMYSLLIYLAYIVGRKSNWMISIGYILSYIIGDVYCVSNSIHAAPVFIISLIASIIILQHKNKIGGIYFMIIGSLTNFFDFLTVPIITLGIPLITYLTIDENNTKDTVKNIISFSVMWGLGYSLTWLSKWLITDIVLKRNSIENVINQIMYRSIGVGNEKTKITVLNSIQRNINVYMNYICIILLSIFFIFCLVNILKNIKKQHKNDTKDLCYIIIAVIPFVWNLMLKEHSFNHVIFVHRIYMVSILAIMVMCCKQIEIKKR